MALAVQPVCESLVRGRWVKLGDETPRSDLKNDLKGDLRRNSRKAEPSSSIAAGDSPCGRSAEFVSKMLRRALPRHPLGLSGRGEAGPPLCAPCASVLVERLEVSGSRECSLVNL